MSTVNRATVASEIKAYRRELATPQMCVCGLWPDIPGPCCHHITVNAQLDALDTLAQRLGLSYSEVTPDNEPDIARDRSGKRRGAWPSGRRVPAS